MAYLMAGDPDLAASESLALACTRGGADLLELGVPFSDPIADGPDIQRAGQRALRGGTRLRDVLELAGRLRDRAPVPLVLMTYMDPLDAMGLEPFARRATEQGVDGVIVPDLPLEESAAIRETLDGAGIDLIQLVAPSTPSDRAAAISRASRGFLYVVARHGTTGVRNALPEDLRARLTALKSLTSLPLAVGFGISSGEQVRVLARYGADGVIIGSAIVRKIEEDPRPASVERLVADLASGLRSPKVTTPALRGSSP